MSATLIGIDCACQAKDIGLARADCREGRAVVTDIVPGRTAEAVVKTVVDWISHAESCLLALDAPLGWPMPMGRELVAHQAGEVVATPPNDLFRRETDRDVQRRFRKTPLDVGADRIARTAHAALSLLGELRKRTGQPIPLLWEHDRGPGTAAIEVYPAATLLAHGTPASSYKKTTQRPVRTRIAEALGTVLTLPQNVDPMLNDADCLDAVVCVLAAVDFVEGRAVPPSDVSTARREGWIWVRP